MTWRVEIAESAARQIKKPGPSGAARIRDCLRDRIAPLQDPRQLGKPLRGSELGAFWRYRVGDYRILCELRDGELLVLVIEVGHRRSIYNRP